MAKYSLEVVRQIWNDSNGDRIEVKEDSDGVGTIEVRSMGKGPVPESAICFPKEQAPLIVQAIIDLHKELCLKEESEKKD